MTEEAPRDLPTTPTDTTDAEVIDAEGADAVDDETTGTGSVIAIGCVVAFVILLAAAIIVVQFVI